jgi:hypothetical protein
LKRLNSARSNGGRSSDGRSGRLPSSWNAVTNRRRTLLPPPRCGHPTTDAAADRMLKITFDGPPRRVQHGTMSIFDDPGLFGRQWAADYDNTLFNLVDPARQADCFRNVARVLEPGGAFVIEAFVPDPADFDWDEQVQMRRVTEDSVTLRVHQYDRGAQTFVRQTITFDGTGVRLMPFAMHYMWPEQIDRMAADAGFRLAERYAGWHREPFDADSTDHISVYRIP